MTVAASQYGRPAAVVGSWTFAYRYAILATMKPLRGPSLAKAVGAGGR
jgi:hypothetical protein